MKVLVIRLSSLGDVVLATAAIAPLKAAACDLHFLTKASFASLLSTQEGVSSVYAYDKKEQSERAAKAALFKWIAEQKFDLIIDLHDSLRTKLWRRRLNALARVYVLKKPRWREVLVLFFRLRSFGLGRGGRARRIREFTQFVLTNEGHRLADLSAKPLTELKVPVTKTAISKPYVVLLPGSAWAGKRWPARYFQDLAEKISAHSTVVVLGGKSESYCEEIANRARKKAPASVSLHGKTNLQEGMQILAEAELVIGNDTGLIHVAEALGKKTIVIEGPTHEALGFTPYRESSKILAVDLACRPCSKTGRFCWRFGSRACVTGVTTANVYQAAMASLAQKELS